MKICIGVTEICGLMNLFADGFRRLGHEVTTVCKQRNAWWPISYDVDFTQKPFDVNDVLTTGYLFGSHDLFFYQWARQTILPEYGDLSYLRSKGKKIVTACMGSDVRDYPAYAQWYKPMASYIENANFNREPLAVPLRAMRMAELCSDVILSSPNQSVLAIRPYSHLIVPLDLSKITCKIPGREVPVILHAPARRNVKGTELILAALAKIQEQGLAFELRFLENLPHQEMIRAMEDADILVDELYFPYHGNTTLEALASGSAVANGEDERYEPYPPNRPIWSITPETIVERLSELIKNREKRIELAKAGRQYVELHHDHVTVARNILLETEKKNIIDFQHKPSFFATHYILPSDEVIPEELRALTSQIIRGWGFPHNASLEQFVQKGFCDPSILEQIDLIVRWHSTDTV